MPSLQQLRHEALALAVERATRPPLLVAVAGAAAGPLDVRVECFDGSSTEFRLLEVVLDGGEILGRKHAGGSVRLQLNDVKTVWHHQRQTGRALAVWLATMVAASGVGAAIAALTGAQVAVGVLGGALAGALGGIGTVMLVDKWEALYEWVVLYDSAAA